MAAALGLLDGAPTEFQTCRDVSFGGVLCALPALTQNGLFDHLDECFSSLGGYYTTTQVVSVLALMALCQIQTVEQLQYQSPGELGKLLGLDRVPEVRCQNKRPGAMGRPVVARLARSVRGVGRHAVRRRPRAALSRGSKRRCPDATWLAKGCVCEAPPATRSTTRWASPSSWSTVPSTKGCWKRWKSDIVPRLLADVPGQPLPEQLAEDPLPPSLRHRLPTAKVTARSFSNRCGGLLELSQVSERSLA